MVKLREWRHAFATVAIAISVIFNIFFIFVLIALVMLIFDLKKDLLTPIVNGLHSSFVGLDEATIISSVQVDDTVPVKLNIPVSTNTVVTLTDNVPVRANATFSLPGGGGTINGAVSIVLPTGLQLPVALNINVAVDDKLPVKLKVPVNIRVKDIQLHDPVNQLRGVLDPFVRLLNNLPDNWPGLWSMIGHKLAGDDVNAARAQPAEPKPLAGLHDGAGYAGSLTYPSRPNR